MGAVSEQTKTIMRGARRLRRVRRPTGRSGKRCADPRRATSCSATRTTWRRRPTSTRSSGPHNPTGKDHYAYTMDLPERRSPRSAGLRESVPRRVPRRGHPHDERELRRARDRAPHARRPRRRGDLRLAAMVLLRDLDRRGGGHARAGARGPRARIRPGSRGDRGGDHAADARDHRELPAQPVGQDLHAGRSSTALAAILDEASRRVAVAASTCSPTRPTTGSSSSRTRSPTPVAYYPHSFLLVHVREDAARARVAARLPRRGARHRGCRRPARCPADRRRSRWDGPIRCRCCSTRSPS